MDKNKSASYALTCFFNCAVNVNNVLYNPTSLWNHYGVYLRYL